MAQLVANAIFSASIYALVGVGFSLIYKCGRFFNFAHAAMISIGAYACFFFSERLSVPMPLAIAAGLSISILVGCATEMLVFRPLRRRGVAPLGFLLVSLGLYIALQNAISLFFGDETQVLISGATIARSSLFGVHFTSMQLLTLVTAVVVLTVIGVHLRATKLGRQIRAVASDPDLARIVGIEPQVVAMWVMALGSALAALAGLLVALDVNMVPTMGMRILLLSVVAVVVGGSGRQTGILGVSAGALFVGLLGSLGVWKLPTQWQDTIVFACLVLFLLFRPEGIIQISDRKV